MLVCVFVCAFGTRDRGCSEHPVFPAPSDFRRDIERVTLGRSAPRDREAISGCDCEPSRPVREGQNVAFCSAAQLVRRPLLTGNGNWSGFSVLVRLAYKLRSGRFGKKCAGGNMRKLILAAASIAALALVGPAAAQSPIIIKFSHVVAPNTPK